MVIQIVTIITKERTKKIETLGKTKDNNISSNSNFNNNKINTVRCVARMIEEDGSSNRTTTIIVTMVAVLVVVVMMIIHRCGEVDHRLRSMGTTRKIRTIVTDHLHLCIIIHLLCTIIINNIHTQHLILTIDIIITNDTVKINSKEDRVAAVVVALALALALALAWIDTVIKVEEVETIVDVVEAPNNVIEIIGEEEGMTI